MTNERWPKLVVVRLVALAVLAVALALFLLWGALREPDPIFIGPALF